MVFYSWKLKFLFFFLTNLQMGPVALPILIPACFTHAFRSDSALFFSLGHQDLSFSFPLNFPLKRSITIHLVLPVGNSHRHIREHDQYYEGSPLSTGPGKFPTATIRKDTQVQINFKVSKTVPLTFLHVSCMLVRGKCWQADFIMSQCVLSPHFRLWRSWISFCFQVTGTILSCFHSGKRMTADLEIFNNKNFMLYSQRTGWPYCKVGCRTFEHQRRTLWSLQRQLFTFYIQHMASQWMALELSCHLRLDSKTYLEAYVADPVFPTQ